jgi:hypothetical protein
MAHRPIGDMRGMSLMMFFNDFIHLEGLIDVPLANEFTSFIVDNNLKVYIGCIFCSCYSIRVASRFALSVLNS